MSSSPLMQMSVCGGLQYSDEDLAEAPDASSSIPTRPTSSRGHSRMGSIDEADRINAMQGLSRAAVQAELDREWVSCALRKHVCGQQSMTCCGQMQACFLTLHSSVNLPSSWLSQWGQGGVPHQRASSLPGHSTLWGSWSKLITH